MSAQSNLTDVRLAISRIEKEIRTTGNRDDLAYFQFHERRFRRMAESILKAIPRNSTILDIGSHYLHSSMILTELGYNVCALDISTFLQSDFVQERMKKFEIEGILENDLESFKSASGMDDRFDGILFTEIFEHITFNPIMFWKRVYNVLKDNGVIYLTTPNSLALPNLIRSFGNIISLRGIGIKVEEVLSYVTYGHHWKEYSRREINSYFKMLSNDFVVQNSFFSYHKSFGKSIRNRIWGTLMVLGHWMYFFSPNIESIIRIKKKNGFKMNSPTYF